MLRLAMFARMAHTRCGVSVVGVALVALVVCTLQVGCVTRALDGDFAARTIQQAFNEAFSPAIVAVTYAGDGKRCVAADYGGCDYLLDAETGRVLGDWRRTDEFGRAGLCPAPDGCVYSASNGWNITVWNLSTVVPERTYRVGLLRPLEVSGIIAPTANRLFLASDSSVFGVDARTGEVVASLPAWNHDDSRVVAMQYDSLSGEMYLLRRSGVLERWSPERDVCTTVGTVPDTYGSPWLLSLAPDCRNIAFTSYDGNPTGDFSINVWNLTDGRITRLGVPDVDYDFVREPAAIVWSPTGDAFAAAIFDAVVVVNVRTWEITWLSPRDPTASRDANRCIEVFCGTPTAMAFSPAGDVLLVGTITGRVAAIDTATTSILWATRLP